MPQPWRRGIWLLLYGWMPAGIGWQLLNLNRLDAYSMLGWLLWPLVPAGYLCAMLLFQHRRGGTRS
jgi:hypothetical protein